TSSSSPTRTRRGWRLQTTLRDVGCTRGAVFGSPVRRRGWTSMIFWWIARPGSRGRDMTINNEARIAYAIAHAEEVHDPAASDERGEKPRLLVESCNPDQTVAALRDSLAGAGGLYDRGVPVRLAFDLIQRGMVAQMMTPDALVLKAHTICRP